MSTSTGLPILTRAVELYGDANFKAGWAERMIDPRFVYDLIATRIESMRKQRESGVQWEIDPPPDLATVKESLSPEEYAAFAASRACAKDICAKHGLEALIGPGGTVTAQYAFARCRVTRRLDIWWAFTLHSPADPTNIVLHLRWKSWKTPGFLLRDGLSP